MPHPMPNPRMLLTILGLALAIGTTDAGATPQSQRADDLARENERLKTELQDLQSRLDAALRRIADLEKAMANTGAAPTPNAAPPPVVVEKSPYGMIETIRKDYAAAVESGEVPTTDGPEDEANRIRHLRATEKWILDRNRRHRIRATWPVAIDEIRPLDRDTAIAVLRGVAPDDGEAAGRAFEMQIPARTASRLERERAEMDADATPWQLDVIFMPNLRLAPDRPDQGPFYDEAFIGPMIESDWTLTFRNLNRATSERRSNRSAP